MNFISSSVDYRLAETTKDPSGFKDPSLITVSYDSGLRKITISSSSGVIETTYQRKEFSYTGSWTSDAHDAANASYFLSCTGDITTATWSTTPWSFDRVQIAFVYKSATANFALRECHGLMPWQAHQEFHRTIGTYWYSGLGLTAGTYVAHPTNSTTPATLAENTFGVDAGVIYDEDIPTSIGAWAEGTYTTAYRSGAAGDWVFSIVATTPYFVSANTLQYNQLTTGGSPTWQLTVATEDNFINVYDFVLPVASDGDSQKFAHIMITGQAQYTTLAAAQQEFPANLNMGDLSDLVTEFVSVNRITYQFNASGAGAVGVGISGRCKLSAVTPIRGSRVSQVAVAGAAPSDHGNLSGLADDDHTQYDLIVGRAANVAESAVDFTVDAGVICYCVNTSGGDKTVTLLDPTTVPGKLFIFVNTSTNNITFAGYAIAGVSGFTIDGNERLQIVSDGTTWKQYARKNMSFWKTGITYCKDTLIEVTDSGYEGLWRCVAQHTASAAFSTDADDVVPKWNLVQSMYIENNATNASGVGDVVNFDPFVSATNLHTATFTFGASGAIEFLVDVNTDGGMVIACDYKSTTINALSDPSGLFLTADSGTGIYIFKSANSSTVSVKNRMGGARTIGILAVRSKISAATAWGP